MAILKLKITGMHCQSCRIKIEEAANALDGVKQSEISLADNSGNFEYDEKIIQPESIIKKIKSLGYSAEKLKSADSGGPSGLKKAVKSFLPLLILGAVFAAAYLAARQAGLFSILENLQSRDLSFGLLFAIGILASFHCIGMCGGFVVSYSAAGLKSGGKSSYSPHLRYNAGRLVSYTSIGAILGGAGSFFGINPVASGILLVGAGVFMSILGLSFIFDFPLAEKIKNFSPRFVAKILFRNPSSSKSRGPFYVGLLNGFMPCGPLQAVQLYALATGSITGGALAMGAYCLGTIPLMFGFGSAISRFGKTWAGKFIKISGVVIIVLGLAMLARGIGNFQGYVPGRISEPADQKESDEFQTVNMDLAYYGYSPNVLKIKKGIPVRWVINARQISGCTDEIILHGYDIRQKLHPGENIIEFTPKETGEIKFSCWMKMVWGRFVVTE